MLKNLVFQSFYAFFSNNRFSSLFAEYISTLLIFKNLLKRILQNSSPLSSHILFGLHPFDFALLFSEMSKFFLNALIIVIPLVSFKGATHAYLLKRSIARNKYLFPLFYLLNDCISAKSTPQILSLNEE